MFGTFFDDEDYTRAAVIEELQEERNDTMLIKAAMPYQRYAAKLAEIIDALERVKQSGGAQ